MTADPSGAGSHPGSTTARVRAPELTGRGWLNTGGRVLRLADLRGRVVVLDFWTFCCVNCLHVLDELRPLERRYGDVLTVVGVHSPKFAHEREPGAVAAAVERYQVTHPVLDDPDLSTWHQYAARAWPTLAVIDPEGYLVASMAGEGHADGLARLIDELVDIHQRRGTLHRGGEVVAMPEQADTDLRFPGKAVPMPDGGLVVTDSARHSLVELAPGPDGRADPAGAVRRRIGAGERGWADGSAGEARFSEPQGLCWLPTEVADAVGYQLVVADTVNHLLRGVRFDPASGDVSVRTVAGTGNQWRASVDYRAFDARTTDLSSPWDVAWYDGVVVIAMAGIHQLWWFDPIDGTAGMWAGTTVEGLRDGALAEAWFAQPSGLAVSPDGRRLWIADSETSALRWVADGEVHTAVGTGLFDFGHVDGFGHRGDQAGDALLQHPLGVAATRDGTVLVADTYNGAVRRYDPASSEVSTVAGGLAEPSDQVEGADGQILVVESAAHRLVPLAAGRQARAPGERMRTERPATTIAAGVVTLDVVFTPPPGQKLDDSFGPPTRLEVSSTPAELLLDGAGTGPELARRLTVNPAVPEGVLQVVAQAATCDIDDEHAACHLTRQDWGVPVRVAGDGADRLPLVLRGFDPNVAAPGSESDDDGR